MTESSPRRLLLGGFLAGLLCNLSGIALGALVLRSEVARIFGAMAEPPSPSRVFVEHTVMRLGLGLAAAWLYRALRPRFAGRGTAILATASFLWCTSYLFSALLLEELRVYSTRVAVIGAGWGLVELLLVVTVAAGIVGDPPGNDAR